jgi:transposase
MVALVRSGRTPDELAEEFPPSAKSIREWVELEDLDEGHRSDGPTSSERDQLRRLRREVKRLRFEQEILGKAAAWFARESGPIPSRDSDS